MLLCRISPSLDHFQDEEVELADETGTRRENCFSRLSCSVSQKYWSLSEAALFSRPRLIASSDAGYRFGNIADAALAKLNGAPYSPIFAP